MTIRERLSAPVDAASLVWFRIGFGLLMAMECARYLAFGWVRDYWIEPTFHFTYYGFDWIRPWPGEGMLVHFIALIALALSLAAGWKSRLSAALFSVGFAYVFLIDQAAYLNHFYAIVLFAGILALSPVGCDASIDARRNDAIRSSTVPAWTIWALRLQIGCIYFFGGLAKLNADWLAGQPLTMWLQASEHLPSFIKGSAGLYLSWAGAAFDLLIVPALIWHRTRTGALVLAIAFHLTNAWLFHIGVFPWMSIAATLMFLPPSHRLFTMIDGLRVQAQPRRLTTSPWVVAALTVWLVGQLTLPLRPFIYPTHVHWTEDGHRFAWRMKLRSKYATGVFWVERPGERRLRVAVGRYLTERQADKMMSRPDMILQFAHEVARDSGPGTRVFALVHASLNGRDAAPLTDVEVDLASEPRTLFPPRWVLPFRDTPLGGNVSAPEEVE